LITEHDVVKSTKLEQFLLKFLLFYTMQANDSTIFIKLIRLNYIRFKNCTNLLEKSA